MKTLFGLEKHVQIMIDLFFALRPQPFPGKERLKSCKIVTHRGEYDNRKIFENTLAAFDGARDCGVWGLEFDVRWTKDLQPVVIHDPDLNRVFGQLLTVADVTLAELKASCPLIPSLSEVIQTYGKQMHLMVEVKEEVYPDPLHQNQVFAELFSSLEPQRDFHIISLSPRMFDVVDFVPKSTFLPIAQLNLSRMSQLALAENFHGVAGHYLLLNSAMIREHHQRQQRVGTGWIGSKNCLFRELNRKVEWIFSNNAAELQMRVNQLLKKD